MAQGVSDAQVHVAEVVEGTEPQAMNLQPVQNGSTLNARVLHVAKVKARNNLRVEEDERIERNQRQCDGWYVVESMLC